MQRNILDNKLYFVEELFKLAWEILQLNSTFILKQSSLKRLLSKISAKPFSYLTSSNLLHSPYNLHLPAGATSMQL